MQSAQDDLESYDSHSPYTPTHSIAPSHNGVHILGHHARQESAGAQSEVNAELETGTGSRQHSNPASAPPPLPDKPKMNGVAYSSNGSTVNGGSGGGVGHPFARSDRSNGQPPITLGQIQGYPSGGPMEEGYGLGVSPMFAPPNEPLPPPPQASDSAFRVPPLALRQRGAPSISSIATDRSLPSGLGPQPISPRSSSLTTQPSSSTINRPRGSSQSSTQPQSQSRAGRIPSRHLLQSALDLAQRAVDLDRSNDVPAALAMYREAVTQLRSVMERVGIELGPLPPGLGLDESRETEEEREEREKAAGKRRKSGLGRSEEEGKTLKGIHDAYIARIGLLAAIDSPAFPSEQLNAVASSSRTSDTISDRTPRGSFDSEDTGVGIGRAMMQPASVKSMGAGRGKGTDGSSDGSGSQEELKAITSPPVPRKRITSLNVGLNTLAETPGQEEEDDQRTAAPPNGAPPVTPRKKLLVSNDLGSPVDPQFVPQVSGKAFGSIEERERASGTGSPKSIRSAQRRSERASMRAAGKTLGLNEELGEADEEVPDEEEGVEEETEMLAASSRGIQAGGATSLLRAPSSSAGSLFQRRRGNDKDTTSNVEAPLPEIPDNKFVFGGQLLAAPAKQASGGQIKSAALGRSESGDFDLSDNAPIMSRSRSISQPGEKPSMDRLQAELPPPPPPTLKPPTLVSLNSSRSLSSQASGSPYTSRQGDSLYTSIPESPNSTVTFNLSRHSPLPSPTPEPIPNQAVHRPFHLLRLVRNTIVSPTGGFLSPRLHIPKTLWTQAGVKLPSLETKVRILELLAVNIAVLAKAGEPLLGPGMGMNVANIGREFGRALDDFEGLLDEMSKMSYKKLGVGGSAGLGLKGKKAGNSGISALGGKFSRSLDRMTNGKSVDSPAAYVDSIGRLCMEAQVLDQHLLCLTGSPSPSYARLPSDARSMIEARLSRTSEFFGSVVLVFVLQDVNLLLSRYLKLSSRYLDD